MNDDSLVTIFSAKEISANAEAEVLKSLLDSAGIESIIKWIPPTFQKPGGIRLMVLDTVAEEASQLIRQAQEGEPTMSDTAQDSSSDKRMVNVFASSNHDAEAEAEIVNALLSSSGLQSMIFRQNTEALPAGVVEVRVPAEEVESAKRILAASQQGGQQQ